MPSITLMATFIFIVMISLITYCVLRLKLHLLYCSIGVLLFALLIKDDNKMKYSLSLQHPHITTRTRCIFFSILYKFC